jgi:hypothetical protein
MQWSLLGGGGVETKVGPVAPLSSAALGCMCTEIPGLFVIWPLPCQQPATTDMANGE